MEFREYQSLPDPACKSLDDFWASVGDLPKPAGEIGERRFSHLTGFCKTATFSRSRAYDW